MKKKIYGFLLCMVGLMASSVAYAQSAPADFDGPTWYDYREAITEGQGSMTDPILINTPGQLAQLAYNVNTGAETYKNKVVALAADINLNKEVDGQRVQWVPIGCNSDNYFRGLFVGMDLKDYAANGFKAEQKHKISGMYINVASAATVKQFGLFGFLGGNVSHLQLEDYSINADLSDHTTEENIFFGGVCGNTIDANTPNEGTDLWFRGSFIERNEDIGGHYVNFAIDDVSVSGSITVNGGTSATVTVGGICGRFGNLGIIHSTANVTINATDCLYVGGICGIDSGKYSTLSDNGRCLYDCLANADITFRYTPYAFSKGPVNVGGIVGLMEQGEEAYACVSMGSINYQHDTDRFLVRYNVGGVCGQLQPMASLFACGSTMLIKSYGYVGGIVGQMKKGVENNPGYKHSMVQCCSFSGHLDASDKILDDKGQTTGIRSQRPWYNHVGGLCGNLEWDEDDNLERITQCLMLGTINSEDYNQNKKPSAVVGLVGTTDGANNPELNPAGNYLYPSVTYCYYDTNLFNGYAIPESYDGGQSVKGLTTEELTSGDMNKVTWLNTSDTEPADYGYRVEKGYYPIFYENHGSNAEYYTYPDNSSYRYANLGNLFNLYDDGYGKANTYSTVYASGALLCAMPVKFVKGDSADDFVSTLSAPTKTYDWDEKLTGRNIIMTCESFFPETDVIKVKDKTATAYNGGTCFVTTTAKVRKKTVTYNRPAILGGTKYIGLNSTIDKEWDGSEATGFAAGTGKANDPYIIKNASQLYHAIKTNNTGEFYKQLCNITITKSKSSNDPDKLNNTLITEACFAPANPLRHVSADWKTDQCTWDANYNGDGHTVSGLYLNDYYDTPPTSTGTFFSLFGNVDDNGSISNLAIVDAWVAPEPSVVSNTKTNEELTTYYGIIAGLMRGNITNCIVQGVNAVGRPCGGICACVRTGIVEDCIVAVVPLTTEIDQFTPFIPYVSNYASTQNSVKNCLSVSPVMFSSADKSTADKQAIKDCYWLKGYEPGNTGQTLDEIGAALGKRDRWTWSSEYFPTLKTFANTDIAKLLMVPVRTDNNYSSSENYLLGFTKMLEFEPGAATWTNLHGTEYIEADSELGIVAPSTTMTSGSSSGMITPMEAIFASLDKSFYYIPMRTNGGDIERGISFVDQHAEKACVKAFDQNNDKRLSLAEISAVTNEQTLTAFTSADVQLEALQMKKFPEFRFFKAVTTLTTQLSGLSNLEEVRLPYNLQSISGDPEFTDNGIRPFSMTKITEVTLPAKVAVVEPGAFFGSEIENIYVDPFNTTLVSRDGILFDCNNALVAFPNGRSGEEIVIPGVIDGIKPGAIYKIFGLQKVFFDTTDYSTVADLGDNGIFTGDEGLVDVYISDATYGSILYNQYLDDASWEQYAEAGKLHCYYPLKIGSAKAATMYIGFDSELPEGLRAYIVTESSMEEKTAYLKRMANLIPNRSPIVIFAEESGTYRLFPLDEPLSAWNMYENKLNGVGRDGMDVYQSDSDRGSILTLGRNSSGVLGFFYYKGTDPIQPYRAYLTYEWVTNASPYLLFSFLEDETTGVESLTPGTSRMGEGSGYYTLDGRKISNSTSTNLPKGIYIHNGKKYVVK